jgi:hypothetical protein
MYHKRPCSLFFVLKLEVNHFVVGCLTSEIITPCQKVVQNGVECLTRFLMTKLYSVQLLKI